MRSRSAGDQLPKGGHGALRLSVWAGPLPAGSMLHCVSPFFNRISIALLILLLCCVHNAQQNDRRANWSRFNPDVEGERIVPAVWHFLARLKRQRGTAWSTA
ncbi:hypothetical protein BGLA2_1740016 [Burkholderia gladioli]|nr:hypothetical protein BGLA2_1740016 [Burkholderia gladioli]